MAQGIDGLLRDKTRPPGIAPLQPVLVDKVVALTLEPPAHEATQRMPGQPGPDFRLLVGGAVVEDDLDGLSAGSSASTALTKRMNSRCR